MGCIKKQTCSRCNGEGRITVYTESEGIHKVGVWIEGREYPRPTKRVTCDNCHGSGKTTYEEHNYVESGSSKMGTWAYFKCTRCGDTYSINQGN